jgi:hypothetical protein
MPADIVSRGTTGTSAGLLQKVAIALLLAACGERTPQPSQGARIEPPPSGAVGARARGAAHDAAAGADAPADAAASAAAGGGVDASAPPDAAVAAEYRVRLGGPSRVATVPRDAACAGPQASCRPDACYMRAPFVERPASRPAMVACERDRDCAVAHTICCGPDSVDVRAVRADQVTAAAALACGRGRACGGQDPALLASFTVGCVEHTCRFLQPIAPAWCEARDTRYRIVSRDGKVTARERGFDCDGPAPACRLDVDCYREIAQRAPRPAPALRRCTRDAECMLAPVECCDCGAREFRAIRMDAPDAWRGQRCGPNPVACPACVTPLPASLAPACLQGSCEVVEVQPAAACGLP